MECRGKTTVQEIALSYCQLVKRGSHTARLVFTQRYFSYRFLLIGDWEECPAVIVLLRGISPHVRESGFPNPGKFCLWNLESWALESGIQFKESGIPWTTGIQNPSSTHKDWNQLPGIRNPRSRIQDCRGFPWYMRRGTNLRFVYNC